MLKSCGATDPVRPYIGLCSPEADDPAFETVPANCGLRGKRFLRGEKWACWFDGNEGECWPGDGFTGENGAISALFIGEIYNLKELSAECEVQKGDARCKSASDICCALYRRDGFRFASKINGMFSIFLWDGREKSVFLYVDRFGSAFPVFYHSAKHLLFGNKLRLLLRSGLVKSEIDPVGAAHFLKYSYVPAPRTIVAGVRKLGPGELLRYKDGECNVIRYKDFELGSVQEYDEREAIEHYQQVLSSSIERKMGGFDAGEIGFFLSGGLDSSANVALAASRGDKQFKTFGIGFRDPELDERPFARTVANHFGVSFSEYVFDGSEIEDLPRMIWCLDEPFMENGLFLTYSGFKAAKGQVDLIIAGDGADQLFGTGGFAYGRPIALRYLLDRFRLRGFADRSRRWLYGGAFYRDSALFKAKVMMDRVTDFNDWFFWGFDENEMEELCRFPVHREELRCFSNHLPRSAKSFDDYYQYALIHQDIEHYACQNVLVKSFRMAELFDIRLRETYLDYEVIDFLVSLPMRLKTKGRAREFLRGRRTTKYLHRLAMKKRLPEEIMAKPKQGGFIRMTMLLSNSEVRKAVFRYLLKSEAIRAYMNMRFVAGLLSEYERGIRRPLYWESYWDCKVNQLMNLLVFAIWYETIFMRREGAPPRFTLSEFLAERL